MTPWPALWGRDNRWATSLRRSGPTIVHPAPSLLTLPPTIPHRRRCASPGSFLTTMSSPTNSTLSYRRTTEECPSTRPGAHAGLGPAESTTAAVRWQRSVNVVMECVGPRRGATARTVQCSRRTSKTMSSHRRKFQRNLHRSCQRPWLNNNCRHRRLFLSRLPQPLQPHLHFLFHHSLILVLVLFTSHGTFRPRGGTRRGAHTQRQ